MYGKKKFLVSTLIIIILISISNVSNALNASDLMNNFTPIELTVEKNYINAFPEVFSICAIIIGIITLFLVNKNKKIDKKYMSITIFCIILNLIAIIIKNIFGGFFNVTSMGIRPITAREFIFELIIPIFTLIGQIIIFIFVMKNKLRAKKEGEKNVKNRK